MSTHPDPSPALLAEDVNGLLYFRFRAVSETGGPPHAISTRFGGRSTGRLASCNMSFFAGEPTEITLGNRQALALASGIQLERWVLGEQVHGAHVARVGLRDRGRGARDAESRLPATDALVTTEAGVALAVLGADCGLVLLWVPGKRALSVAHAGWRGLAAGVLSTAVGGVCTAASAKPPEICAAVAPAIGSCCYQVDAEVRRALVPAPGDLEQAVEEREHSYWLDIAEACKLQLLAAGLREKRVTVSGVCTSCRRDLFYSARGDGEPTGRFALVATLE